MPKLPLIESAGDPELAHNTPLVQVDGIWVKREDLCCPDPGPPFSKMRGVFAHLRVRPETTVGVLDTYHSKAGWAVAYACRRLGKRCINFYPRYKNDPPGTVRPPQQVSRELGAELVPLQAGRSAILFHRARAWLREREPGSYMMPNALKLSESVEETAAEVESCDLPGRLLDPAALWVVSISSGTIAAGVLLGLHRRGGGPYRVVLHQGYSRPPKAVYGYLEKRGATVGWCDIFQVDEGYAYRDRVELETPFPCSPYYDLKAWRWLKENQQSFRGRPLLFWNIGA